MIQKVYEVEPMACPRCGGRMKVIAFLMEPAVAEKEVLVLPVEVEVFPKGQAAVRHFPDADSGV